MSDTHVSDDVERLVVVGASLAGLRAVEAARRQGFTGSITLIGAEPHGPYDRPPLSKGFLDDSDVALTPVLRSLEELRDDLGVELVLGDPATALDTAWKAVHVGERAIPYDALVIATGAVPRHLPWGQGLPGVHALRSLDDAIYIRGALDDGARTVIVGAGFIGSELASSARKRGLPVTILEALPTPLVRAVGARLGDALSLLHRSNGTELRTGATVVGIEGTSRIERVLLADGSVLEADLVVVGIGADPATGWLEGSGLTIADGVVCDERLWTGMPGVYAAGDVARWHNTVFDCSMRLEHWTAAAEQGARAAQNALAPADAKPYETVPYFWSDWYGSRIQFAGVPHSDEVDVVDGDPEQGGRWVALYRQGDRLVGALAVNAPTEIMKYRIKISQRTSWSEAIAFAETRRRSPEPLAATA